mgnify:CR=1 FL=1
MSTKNVFGSANIEEYFDFPMEEKLSLIFPVLRFHTRYSRLTEFDVRKIIQKNELSYKGYLYDIRVNRYENKGQKNYQRYLEQKKRGKKLELQNIGLKIQDYAKEKVEQIYEFCQKNNCELVLITMPNTDERALEKFEVFKEFACSS